MKIAIGNDHWGVDMKNKIISTFSDKYEFVNFGTDTKDSVDYPDYVKPVCDNILNKKADFGILICGSGVGVSIAANRFHGIRAGLCFHSQMANMTRRHNNSNILCLGADIIGMGVALECVRVFLETSFEGGRHEKRIEKIENLSC